MARILRFSLRRDKPSTFEALLRPHVESLYKLAYRFTNNTDDAEDLLQDVLVKLYPKVAELEKVEQLRPWLARVMYRMWVDTLRARGAVPGEVVKDVSDMEKDADPADPETNPEHAYHLALSRQKLLQALGRLSEDHRIVLILHDVEGYSLEEMKVVLDSPIGTLKSRLHRARERLRNLLDDGTF